MDSIQKFQDGHLMGLSDQYHLMLNEIINYFPVIEKVTANFNKSQSQFMNNMLTVSHPTELRNARQILAEIEKTKLALSENGFNILKKKNSIKKKEVLLLETNNLLDRELLDIEISELQTQLKISQGYVEGAIRKMSAYFDQYKQLLRSVGKEEFTEEDFEKDEERYHIMKMFEQGLCAARAHGGVVDEGNQIYAHQIGINGTTVQCEVSVYLLGEQKMLKSDILPPHTLTLDWLGKMATKYAGSANEYASRKGMILLDTKSLHKLA